MNILLNIYTAHAGYHFKWMKYEIIGQNKGNEPATRDIPLPTLLYRIRLGQLKCMRVCHDM